MDRMQRDMMKQWAHFFLTYKFALDEVETKLNILNEEFQFIHDYNPIEHVKTRIKNPESVMDKLRRKNMDINLENAKEHIRDIAGVRVICSFSTDIYQILEMISQQTDVKVVEVKDYVLNPKPNGYKSLHLIVEIPVFLTNRIENVLVEIQIRTSAMDFWASLEHKIYYKYNEGIPPEIQQQLKESADMINLLDKRMLALNQEVLKHREYAVE
nr:GTP pyrophosphokinase family protein [Paenibacillus algorifonticola]